MSDDRLDQRLREAARSYNAPPETPRAAMWAGIQAARRAGAREAGDEDAKPRGSRLQVFGPRRVAWAAAAAAVLAAGIGIGRVSIAPETTAWRGPSANA